MAHGMQAFEDIIKKSNLIQIEDFVLEFDSHLM
jgi:hypothetical protein